MAASARCGDPLCGGRMVGDCPIFGREQPLACSGQTERRGVVKKQFAIYAGLLLLGFGTAATTSAQTVYAGPGLPDPALPPYEVMSIVRSTGTRAADRPMRRGPVAYVLVAVDRVGRQMRVVVDAQLGDIVRSASGLGGRVLWSGGGASNGLPERRRGAARRRHGRVRIDGDLYGLRIQAATPRRRHAPPRPPFPTPGRRMRPARLRRRRPCGMVSGATLPAAAAAALARAPKLALNEAPGATLTGAPAAAPAAASPSPAPSGAGEAAKQIE